MNHTSRALLLTWMGLSVSCVPHTPETLAPAAPAVETLAPTPPPELGLEYSAFTLENGLRVIVHTDRKAPVVAVSVWYGVGSKDEPEGRTGFAHLFEHLMFNGSENYNDEWFGPLEEVGATGLNGTTWFDRTNYFETVPTPALERVLWMESDRMGHMLGAITQARLDEQRGVVQNEKRQGDNQPYGRVEYAQLEGLFPAGHPYHHSTIGSMEDLNAADLATVRDWFEQYYGAANAIVVLAGDIDEATARPLMTRYFGDIPAGPPVTRVTVAVPDRQANTRTVLQDRVPQARLIRSWAVPSRVDRDTALLTLATTILGDGKSARLYREFVYDSQVATSASASLLPFVLTSMLDVEVTVHDPTALDDASARLDALLAEFIANGPTAAELQRARTMLNAETVRGLEQVGGFSGKASLLAEGALYAGDPDFINTWLSWINTATPQDVQQAAARWMADGYHQVDVLPYPEYSTVASDVDRKKGLPGVGQMPTLAFPTIEQATLANGTPIFLARRPGLPVVDIAIQFDAGYAADASSGTLGAASFAAAMLDEGTPTRTSLQISAEAEGLGAQLGVDSSLDNTTLWLSALSGQLAPSVALWADVVRNATFPAEEVERLRTRWLANIQQEKAQPVQLAMRLLPPALYGADHAYGVPLTGSGTEASIQALTRESLVAFRDTWLRPDNARILVVGDTTLAEIQPLLEAALSGWTAPATALPQKSVGTVGLPSQRRVILIDRPGSPQSLILAGHLAPAPRAPDSLALDMANGLFGGEFSARINMNLREDKHWAYGAYSFFTEAREQRPWMMYAPVQTDRTGDALRELGRELDGYLGKQPAASAELERLRKQRINELPGSFETNDAVLGSMLTNASLGRPLDHAAALSGEYAALSLEQVRAAAKASLHPEALIWIVVGDRAQIESQIRALKWGPIEYWNADGERVD